MAQTIIPDCNARTDSAEYRAWKMQTAKDAANARMDQMIKIAQYARRGIMGAEDARECMREQAYFLTFEFYRLYSAMKYRPVETITGPITL